MFPPSDEDGRSRRGCWWMGLVMPHTQVVPRLTGKIVEGSFMRVRATVRISIFFSFHSFYYYFFDPFYSSQWPWMLTISLRHTGGGEMGEGYRMCFVLGPMRLESGPACRFLPGEDQIRRPS